MENTLNKKKSVFFSDTINMIDYETMDINFIPFDIASYLIFLLRSHLMPGQHMFCEKRKESLKKDVLWYTARAALYQKRVLNH